MAYSRWGYSKWYIWYDASSGTDILDQVLAVDGGDGGPIHLSFMEVFEIVSRWDFTLLNASGLIDAQGIPAEHEHLDSCLREFLHDARMEGDEEYREAKQAEWANWEKYAELRRSRMSEEERVAEDEKTHQAACEAGHKWVMAKLREPSWTRRLLPETPTDQQ